MSFKGDTIIEMAHAVKRLTERKVLTPEQMERIGDDMPVAAMRDARLFMQYIDRCQVDLVNAANVLSWACANQEFLSLIKADAGVTYRQAKEGVDRAQTNIIVIHRVGYILHETMLTVGDLLERDRRMKFAVKKHYRDAEDCWRRYERPRQQRAERSAWCLVQDHLRLNHDAVAPALEKVYETLRDYMIRLAWRDVELKARCQVMLLMGKVFTSSFHQFFKEFHDETRVDYTRVFIDDDLSPMIRHLAQMTQALGIDVCQNQYGLWELAGFNPSDNQRVEWAWDDFMRLLRNDDLTDQTALHAIELNPIAQEHYRSVLEEADRERQQQGQQEIADSISRLAEKYKVTKQ